MPAAAPGLPLDGIRVLAVEQFLSGPMCTMWLGDMGAEVIKIEPPGKGDPRRSIPPALKNDSGESITGAFFEMNRNKKSVTLDFKNESGQRLFKELVRRSDVVFDNLKPGTMDRLGLGYEVLREVNPLIICAGLSGFGRMESLRGPYSDWPAFDAVIQAMAGIMDRIGFEDGPPMLGVSGISDRLTGMLTGYAIVLALFMRERTGVGQFIDMAMYDSLLCLNERAISMYSMLGIAFTRGKDDMYAPMGAFKTKDGWVGLLIPGEDMWQRFCQAIGRMDLFEHPLCKGTPTRVANYKGFLKPIVDEWMGQHTRSEVVELFLVHGVPVGPVQNIHDIFACPQVEARRMLLEVDDPVGGKKKFANNPFRFSGVTERPPVRPPRLGEHNQEILGDLLGCEDSELERLRRERII